jgi:hypothetical protein
MMRTIFLAILLIFIPKLACAQQNSFLTTAPQPDYYAWWLRTEYHPFGTDVRGIPVAKIRSGWCKANEFRRDLFPSDFAPYLDSSMLSFVVDGSKTPQTALTGVYETCKGKRGAFFLVVARPGGKPPAVRFIVEMEGEREFAMVDAVDASTVAVFHCMECDHVSKFKWNRKKRSFMLLSPDKDE